nr:PREDICTED: LOW QUALITY PROTEIN: transcription factor CP2-like protein 1 [Bos mutus]
MPVVQSPSPDQLLVVSSEGSTPVSAFSTSILHNKPPPTTYSFLHPTATSSSCSTQTRATPCLLTLPSPFLWLSWYLALSSLGGSHGGDLLVLNPALGNGCCFGTTSWSTCGRAPGSCTVGRQAACSGQSYEVQMLCNPKLVDATQEPRLLKSMVRVVFHDRRLQYTEQQQLDWSGLGDRILDINIPLSVGVLEPQVLPSQLNTVEFYWDPTKRTSLFLQVHCISTKFTRKKVGEKSVPFCLQIDTFKPSDKELPLEHLHSAGCLLKVFKPKGADRKLKTDREKIEKQPVHERNNYQTACESTIFMELLQKFPNSPARPEASLTLFIVWKSDLPCSPWPEPISGAHLPLSPFALTSPHSCKLLSLERLCSSPSFALDTLGGSLALGLNPGASILETQQWLLRHWFSSYWRLLASFTGTDLLKLTPQDLIQICGAADGIRLFNTLRARPIRHRLTLYVAQETCRQDDEVPKNPDSGFYQEISLDELSAVELLGKLAELLALPANQVHRLFHQGPGGILILLSDQVAQNLKDESYFVAVVKKVQNLDGYYLVLT